MKEPAPAKRTYIRVEPHNDTPRPLPSYVGSTEARGGAYLFLLPFDIYVTPLITTVHLAHLGSRKLKLYPPFRSRGEQGSALPEVALEDVPYEAGTTPPTFDNLLAKDFAVSRDLGDRTDALRIDVFPPAPEAEVSAIAEQLLDLIRTWTGQWWVKRDRRHSEALLRNQFAINERGERLGGVSTVTSLYGRLGFERALDETSWHSVAMALSAGDRIALSRDTYFDAVYFHSTGDIRRAIIETAIAFELMLDEAVQAIASERRVTKAQVSKVFEGNDFLKHLTRAGHLAGRSFSSEHPEIFEKVREIWIARGHVAHGEPPLAPFPEGVRETTLDDIAQVFIVAGPFMDWLKSLSK